MVQLIIVTRRKTLCHWLNALAITRSDLPRYVKSAHSLPLRPKRPTIACGMSAERAARQRTLPILAGQHALAHPLRRIHRAWRACCDWIVAARSF
jgi:hypothetical protein